MVMLVWKAKWQRFERTRSHPAYATGFQIGFILGATGVLILPLFMILLVAALGSTI